MPLLLILSFVLAPSYVVSIRFLGLPANLLMLWLLLCWLVFGLWLFKQKLWGDFFLFLSELKAWVIIFMSGLFLSAVFGLAKAGFNRANLGQFLVLFFQPLLSYFVFKYIINKIPTAKNYLVFIAYWALALAGGLAIIQYFTLLGLPQQFWGNALEPKRATAFFLHPNFYALWAAPLLALLIPDLGLKIKNKAAGMLWTTLWLLGALGLLLSFSRAGWLGLLAATSIYFLFGAEKKIRKIIFIIALATITTIIAVPNLRWRLLLPFYGERSAASRIELWQSGIRGLAQSPILGLGLNGYAQHYRQLQTDNSLPNHNFPHNIFLDFWLETGLLGLISFLGIISFSIITGLKRSFEAVSLGAALFLIALLAQGQIDNPYFKNDLALVFWIILSLI